MTKPKSKFVKKTISVRSIENGYTVCVYSDEDFKNEREAYAETNEEVLELVEKYLGPKSKGGF